jgi:enamine deaminase RidA (YjgF/YER057c/UK114 family)
MPRASRRRKFRGDDGRAAVIEFGLSVPRRFFIALSLSLVLVSGLSAQKRKNKKDIEPPTQVLPPLPEPPDAIAADTARLSFQVSPLSNKGLLSQQIRDALKALLHDNHGAQIVKLRAFVAGSGDLRRVQQIVAEEFTDKKLALPVISTIQVGALPLVGAQVALEATSMEKQPLGHVMLEYFPPVRTEDVASTLGHLRVKSKDYEMAQVTCFVTSLDDAAGARASIVAAFPRAALNLVQSQRQSVQPYFGCEGIGRREAPNQIMYNGPFPYILGDKIILTGTKLVFRDEDTDVRLAFQRQLKAIEALGATKDDVIWTEIYALTNPMAMKVRDMRREFMSQAALTDIVPPLFEGLPSTDATAAIELIARGH